ncbi:MAG TPA: GGDEF domain-containing protein [Terriglobales bacterium]|nr:GGDEF domain-containing protein [Terriglobales bacterium]
MHPYTLAFACLVLELCCGAGLYLMSRAGAGLRGLRWFTWAYVCAAIAIVPEIFHGPPAPPAISNLVRFFLLLSAALLTQGAAEFVTESAQTLAWGAWLVLTVMGGEMILAMTGPATGGQLSAITLFALAYAAQSAVTALLLWTHRAEGERAACQATAILLCGIAGLSLWRGMLTRRGWIQPQILVASPLREVLMGLYLVLIMGMAFGFLWMSIARQRRKLVQQACTDALTGALNRRALDAAAEGLAAACRARGAAMAVLAIDLDRFKLLNDTFGHAGGDAMLTAVAQLLTVNLRPTDVVARFGGEEFIAILPERDATAALAIAERLRRRLADMSIEFEGSRLAVTASFGVAHSDGSEAGHLEWRELLRRADHRLYEAKQAGRNCIRGETLAPYSRPAAATA